MKPEIYCPYFIIDRITKRRESIYCEGGRISFPDKTQRIKYIDDYCSSKENHTSCSLCKMLNDHYGVKEEVKKEVKFYDQEQLPKGEVKIIMAKKELYFELTKDTSNNLTRGKTSYIFVHHMGYIKTFTDEASGESVDIAFRYMDKYWKSTHVASGLKIAEHIGKLEEAEAKVKEMLPSIIKASKTEGIKRYAEELEEYKREVINNEAV